MHTDSAAPLLQVEGLSQRFAVRTRRARPPLAMAGGRRPRQLGSEDAARPWASSASPAAASRRSPARSCNLSPPSAGRVVFDGVDLATADAATLRRMRARMQIVMQDPFSALNPRRTVGSSIADGVTGPAAAPSGARTSGKGGPFSRGLRRFRTSSPVASASVSASPAPWARSGAADRGRGRFGTGCLGPGADPEPAGRAASGLRAELSLHLAQSIGGARLLRPDRGDVSGPDRRDRPDRGDLQRPCSSLYPRADLGGADPGARPPTRRACPASARATCRAR
jgi:hypothetical protein